MSARTTRSSHEVNELRWEITRLRTELGDTVEELAARADVKARLRRRATTARAEVRDQARRAVAETGQFARRHEIELLALTGAAGLIILAASTRIAPGSQTSRLPRCGRVTPQALPRRYLRWSWSKGGSRRGRRLRASGVSFLTR